VFRRGVVFLLPVLIGAQSQTSLPLSIGPLRCGATWRGPQLVQSYCYLLDPTLKLVLYHNSLELLINGEASITFPELAPYTDARYPGDAFSVQFRFTAAADNSSVVTTIVPSPGVSSTGVVTLPKTATLGAVAPVVAACPQPEPAIDHGLYAGIASGLGKNQDGEVVPLWVSNLKGCVNYYRKPPGEIYRRLETCCPGSLPVPVDLVGPVD
jgi:hypothetical protein